MAKRGQHEQGRRSGGHPPTTSPWEHAAAALGAALVLAAAAFVLRDALSGSEDPVPRVTVHVDTIQPYSAGYVVRIRARNDGGETAAHVVVEGELRSDTGVVESSQTTIDFIPAASGHSAMTGLEPGGGLGYDRC